MNALAATKTESRRVQTRHFLGEKNEVDDQPGDQKAQEVQGPVQRGADVLVQGRQSFIQEDCQDYGNDEAQESHRSVAMWEPVDRPARIDSENPRRTPTQLRNEGSLRSMSRIRASNSSWPRSAAHWAKSSI